MARLQTVLVAVAVLFAAIIPRSFDAVIKDPRALACEGRVFASASETGRRDCGSKNGSREPLDRREYALGERPGEFPIAMPSAKLDFSRTMTRFAASRCVELAGSRTMNVTFGISHSYEKSGASLALTPDGGYRLMYLVNRAGEVRSSQRQVPSEGRPEERDAKQAEGRTLRSTWFSPGPLIPCETVFPARF